MAGRDKTPVYLSLILILVLGVRLFIAFQAPGFSDDSAYFNLRQIESITDNLHPLYQDNLSYGGRLFIFLPVFHYACALFDMFMPLELIGKIIPNLFASLLVLVVYFLTFELTGDKKASLLSAFTSGFIPVFFSETLNKISIYSLVVPGIFLALLFLVKVFEKERYISHFIIAILVLSFIHASSFIIIVAMGLYVGILKIQRMKLKKYTVELIIFSVFFMIWLQFLLFKKAFLDHGIFLLWQNMPSDILSNYFTSIPLFDALIFIGFVPFLFGLYAAYKFSFKTKDKKIHLLIAFGLGVFFLLWLKLIQIELGLIFLGVVLTVGFGRAFSLLMSYIDKTRFTFIKRYVAVAIIVLIFLTSVLPSYVNANYTLDDVPSQNEIDALEWLRDNSEEGIVLSTLNEGHLISYIGERKNFMDSNFLFIEDIDQRYEDLRVMYTSLYTTNVVQLLNKYNIKYIYFSNRAVAEYGVEELSYLSESCFNQVYENDEVKIYKSLCRLEEEEP